MPKPPAIFRSPHSVGPSARPSTGARGYGARWQRYRLWYLRQPECVLCASCQRQISQEVDHIIPCAPRTEAFYDPANHQPLCGECHKRKTQRYECGRALTPADVADRELMLSRARSRAASIEAANRPQVGWDKIGSADRRPTNGERAA